METMLVTGGCGFIGSNFIRHIHSEYPDVNLVNLDILTYAGNPENLKDLEADTRYTFIKGDITDNETVGKVFAEHAPDIVVHFAAESHVDRSVLGPQVFINTNVMGTQVLLDAARKSWAGNYTDKRFIHVSTDEVYGSLGTTGYFTETTPLSPNSPYSASKAGSDFCVRAYCETFGFPGIITRCSNNYGPYQYPEKLIPLMIAHALDTKHLPVYGDGKNIRDWLYVGDHCTAIDTVLRKGKPGEVYNIGGNNEWYNIDIVKKVLSILGRPESLISYVKDRPGHDRRYAIDASKIKRELGWEPSMTFEQGIEKSVTWYLDNEQWWRKLQNKHERTSVGKY
jgi:dTDP-glucose 4,6-dehydratase